MNKGIALTLTDFDEVESPFTKKIMQVSLPPKFNMQQFNTYDGSGDPIKHLESYCS